MYTYFPEEYKGQTLKTIHHPDILKNGRVMIIGPDDFIVVVSWDHDQLLLWDHSHQMPLFDSSNFGHTIDSDWEIIGGVLLTH